MTNRILVIEDDQSTRSYVARGLREAGFVVEEAGQGNDGLFLATSAPFDAIVLDRNLPGLDGLSALKAMRAAHPEAARFDFTSAETFFGQCWGLYIRDQCTPEEYVARATKICASAVGGGKVGPSETELAAYLLSREREEFDKFRRHFFMEDLFPENASRFPLSFDQVEALARPPVERYG